MTRPSCWTVGTSCSAAARVRETLTARRMTLEVLAKRLIEKEVVDRDALIELLADTRAQ